MIAKSAAFEKTYKEYLSQIATIDFKSNAEKLGGQIDGDGVIIPFFGKPHRISPSGITDMSGKQPTLAISVVLSKYLLLCPGTTPKENDWVSYRDFKDAAPLAGAFANNAEKGVAINFSGRLNELEAACNVYGGRSPALEVSYDLSRVFDALPKVPVLMLFNDKDDEFPAKCSLLFERRAEKYLDMECLAIVGWLLSDYLKYAAGGNGVTLL